jgi:RNA recognition motif-containing protein
MKPKTSLMVRNIPANINRSKFMELLHSEGFSPSVKVLYVPLCLRDGLNLGYAFIDFDCAETAELCMKKMEGFSRWEEPCDKALTFEWSGLQGREAYIERYKNSEVMHEQMMDEARPAIFDNGVRLPFPSPTKKLNVRRRRFAKGDTAIKQS